MGPVGIAPLNGRAFVKMDEEVRPERWENREAGESQRPRKERMPGMKMSPVITAAEFRNVGFKGPVGLSNETVIADLHENE